MKLIAAVAVSLYLIGIGNNLLRIAFCYNLGTFLFMVLFAAIAYFLAAMVICANFCIV